MIIIPLKGGSSGAKLSHADFNSTNWLLLWSKNAIMISPNNRASAVKNNSTSAPAGKRNRTSTVPLPPYRTTQNHTIPDRLH